MSARILIADKLAKRAGEILQAAGHEVVTRLGLSEAELCDAVGGFDVLLVRSAVRVTRPIIDAANALKVIGRAGTGVDNIDVPAATARGILVMNVPGGNTVSAAEHTIALMFAMARNVPRGDASLRRGEWERSALTGTEITGKTLGVVGFGKIGQLVADRAIGLKMKVVAFDLLVPSFVMDAAGVEPVATLDALLERADVVTLHVPGGAATKGLIGRDALAKCRKGALLINCARGGVIDESALAEALRSGHIGGAAIDVFEAEPPKDSPLLGLPNVVLTPHLGASTHEAQVRVAIAVAEQVRDFLATGRRHGAVN
jgi:D-3-phosphoglycerate dehydrogenase